MFTFHFTALAALGATALNNCKTTVSLVVASRKEPKIDFIFFVQFATAASTNMCNFRHYTPTYYAYTQRACSSKTSLFKHLGGCFAFGLALGEREESIFF